MASVNMSLSLDASLYNRIKAVMGPGAKFSPFVAELLEPQVDKLEKEQAVHDRYVSNDQDKGSIAQ